MNRNYYAAVNSYATNASMGFANTWSVLVFDSRSNRDAYVSAATDRATRAIKRDEVTRYRRNLRDDGSHVEPRPFSGQYWGIVPFVLYLTTTPGLIGSIEVCEPDDPFPRFYN